MTTSATLTFLTDFGLVDHYVAAMKAVALARAPGIHLIDITHAVPPQDVARGAFVLAESAPWFPPGTVHVAVVDPGVGTARRAIVARIDEQIVVAPDNGVVGQLWGRGTSREAWAIEADLGLPERSATFEGRDLFAPVGAMLASGAVEPAAVGPAVEPELGGFREPTLRKDGAEGRVQAVDGFGNLISDLRGIPTPGRVSVDGRAVPFVRTYGAAREGDLVALFGSSGWLEVARVNGDASEALGVGVDASIKAAW